MEDKIFGIPKELVFFGSAIVIPILAFTTLLQTFTLNAIGDVASQQGKTNEQVKKVQKLLVSPTAKPTPVISVPVTPTKKVTNTYQYPTSTKSGQVR